MLQNSWNNMHVCIICCLHAVSFEVKNLTVKKPLVEVKIAVILSSLDKTFLMKLPLFSSWDIHLRENIRYCDRPILEFLFAYV